MGKKSLLFTGASGFLGRNIIGILSETYMVETIGLSDSDTYTADISNRIPEINNQYDIVLHAIGKAHEPSITEDEKKLVFDVNYEGTKNLCAALDRNKLPADFVFISSVAVYGLDAGELINEDHPLNGSTAYALSKIESEKFLTDWSRSRNIKLTILRPSLIAGLCPPGNLGDMIHAIGSGRYLSVGNGEAKKSMIMAEDIAHILPKVAGIGGVYNLTDDHHPSFRELELLIANQLGKKRPVSIPYLLARLLALAGDIIGNKFPLNSSKLRKIVNMLTFSNEKAKRILNWTPIDVLANFNIK